MQEIEYEDGTKTKKRFEDLVKALDDAKERELLKPIKKVTITKIIPKKKNDQKRKT